MDERAGEGKTETQWFMLMKIQFREVEKKI